MVKKILFNKGDVIFLENIEGKNIVRQIPQVNGAIVVIDPHNGNVLAMSEVLVLNLVNLIERLKQRDSLDLLLNHLFIWLH